MTDIVDLSLERAKREEPDDNCVMKDDFGRPLYRFALEYSYDNSRWAAEVWAYSFEDAAARVEGMKSSLEVVGQIFAEVPY